MTNAVIYARYSSARQRDVSIQQQIDVCSKYAAEEGYNIVRTYEDRAISGTTDKRPSFQDMIHDAPKREWQAVIVYALDRFARDTADHAIYSRELEKHGVKVVSATENIPDSPSGILLSGVLTSLSAFYSKELSYKIKRGLRDNASKCMVNGVPPFGYRRGSDGKYEIDPTEAEVVKEIYDRFINGDTLQSISDDLNARGIKTRKGNAFGKCSFHTMLENEIYIGVYKYGDVRIENGVPAILDRETFEKVSSCRHNNRKSHRMREGEPFVLTGKLFCSCGGHFTGYSGRSETGRTYDYYKCMNCKKSHPKQATEEAVASVMYGMLFTDENINQIADDAVLKQSKTSNIPLYEEHLKEARKRKDAVMNAIYAGIITNTTKEALQAAEAEEARYTDLIEQERKKILSAISREDIVNFLQLFRNGDMQSIKYRDGIFRTFLEKAVISDLNEPIDITLREWLE